MSTKKILKAEIEKLQAIKQALKREFGSPLISGYWVDAAIHNIEQAIDHLDTEMQE